MDLADYVVSPGEQRRRAARLRQTFRPGLKPAKPEPVPATEPKFCPPIVLQAPPAPEPPPRAAQPVPSPLQPVIISATLSFSWTVTASPLSHPLIQTERSARSTAQQIRQDTAHQYGIRVSLLDSHRRSRELVKARQHAIWRVVMACPAYSYPMIGRLFGGRDHTTILHSYRKFCWELRNVWQRDEAVAEILRTCPSFSYDEAIAFLALEDINFRPGSSS